MSDDPNNTIPGYAGSQGPFKDEYTKPHVYARDIHSGAGNCVCGAGLGEKVHTEAAPGIDIPETQRQGMFDHLAAGGVDIKKLWQENPNYNIDNPTTIPGLNNPQKPQKVISPEPDRNPLGPVERSPDQQLGTDMSGASETGNPANNRNSYLNVFDF